MNPSFMLNPHQTPWAWELLPRKASTLHAEPVARWLRVECGNVWLTRANGTEQADDIWLHEGESLALPEGSEWVVEGWPHARVSLMQPSPGTAEAVKRARAPWWKAS